MLPVTTSVLEPVEIVSVLDLFSFDSVLNFKELVTLVDLDRHEGFDLGTNKLRLDVFIQTHFGQSVHDSVYVFLFLLKVLHLVSLLAAFKSFLQLLGPGHLNTKQRDL